MDQESLEQVCKQIYRRFPSFDEKLPKVSKQAEGRYLLVFSVAGTTPDGKEIKQNIRVVATEDGRIIKTSMSR